MGQEVKNLLRAQSKYGLMGSSAKTGKFYFRGSQEHFLHKSAFWDRTRSQIFKWNSIISFHSKVIVILPIWVSLALGVGQAGGGVSRVNNYSQYEFRNVQR